SASICQGQTYTFGSQTLTSSGTYNRTVTSANGCDSVITLTLTVNPNSSASIVEEICQGQTYSFGSQTLIASGTYNRTIPTANGCDSLITLTLIVRPNSSTSLSATICQGQSYFFGSQTLTAPGTYNLTVPSANGCDSVITVTLTVKPNSSASISATICQGQTYTFGSQSLTSAGTYNRTVTATNGCDSIITLTLSVRSTPSLIAQPQNSSVDLYDSATFSVQANEATSYQWQVSTNGNTSFVNIQNNQLYAGSGSMTLIVRALTLNMNNYRYRCVVSNSCGEINSDPASLTVNTPSAVQFYFDNQTSCQNQNGSLVSIPVRANNFFRVAAMNGRIIMPNGSSLISVSNVNSSIIGFASAILGSDTVSFSWFRNNGVTLSDSSVLFRINLTYNNSVNGDLSWVSGTLFAFNEFNSGLPVVGNNGTIISREVPIVNAGNDINSCPGATVVLSASGNASSFSWSNGSTGTNITVNPFVTTTYVVSGINQFGCSKNDTVVVYVNPVVPVQIANADTVRTCSIGNGVQLLATGANSYIWTPSIGLSSSTIPNPTANPTSTTRYKVIGISASGCVTEDSMTIIVSAPVNISFNLTSNSVCLNQTSIALNATPIGGTFAGSGVVNGSFSPSTAGPGNHIVTYTYIDQNSGCISQATQNISVNGLPNGSAGLDQIICQGQTATLSATGGSSYLWNNGNTSPSISVNPSQTTIYTVSIFNSSGCFVVDTIIVEVSTGPNITLSGNATICSGGSTQIIASGGTSYSWSPNVGISSTTISNPIFNPQTTTTYTVYAANSNGCVSANTITIIVNDLPIVNAGNDTISCGNPIVISASSSGTGTLN
ncbi:MAG: hypothetical protein ACKO7X_08190, partial [Bacteroidota bacterium]